MALEFSEKSKQKIAELRTHYPTATALILPVLHLAQKEFGYISKEAIDCVAQILDKPPLQIFEVVSFYSMYNRKPVGKYNLRVCHNLSCCLLGAENVFDHISKKLNIKKGETTPDRMFTLTGVECLGSCDTAPVLQINDEKYHENLTLEKVDELLNGLK